MATYNKRGYKPPKPEEEKTNNQQFIEEKDSETAEVFNSLDSSANKVGSWFKTNQNKIFGVIGILSLATLGYLGYQKFIVEPKEETAANEMAQAQFYYTNAVNAQPPQSDSLYNLALNGGEGKLGFLKIAEEYSGTNTGNTAHYYIGVSYLNTGKYKEAIKHLEKYNSNDEILMASANGAIGDAFAELKQYNDAYDYYVKAVNVSTNDYTTPKYSFKAAIVAIELGKKEEAKKLLNNIKNNYKNSPQNANVDFYLGMVE